jgi:DNA-binding GntR family transcriptional regulator
MRVREALEALLVQELCETITTEQINFCKERLLELLERSRKGKQKQFPQEFFDFHDYLMENVENPFLFSLINIISNKTKILRFQSGVFAGREEPAIAEHLKIIEAIEERNADLAVALIKSHIINARDNTLSAISAE